MYDSGLKARILLSTLHEKPFWKRKPLNDITEAEWESLCSRCGICCFQRITDLKTGEPHYTSIRCRHLNAATLQCDAYHNRFDANHGCEKVTRENIRQLKQLPDGCGYRTIAEGRDLKWWHPLISGDPDTVHQAGISFLDKEIISEDDIIAGDLMKYLIVNLSKYFFTNVKKERGN